MKFVIISDIDMIICTDEETTRVTFNRGQKMVRKIVQGEPQPDVVINVLDEYFSAEQYDGPSYDPTEAPEADISQLKVSLDACEQALIEWATKEFNAPIIGEAQHSAGTYYLRRLTSRKYALCMAETTIIKGWFSNSEVPSERIIGHVKALEIYQEIEVESPRINELTTMIRSLMLEKTDILAESCSLQSELNNVTNENEFLVGLVQKFQDELVGMNEKYERHDKQLETIMERLNRRLTESMTKRPAPVRVESLADQVVAFDKRKLRSTALSQTSFI